METPPSEGAIPATNDNNEENLTISQADKPKVAHPMRVLTQALSAKTSIRLPLRRSPSPIADPRIPLWKKEKRAFKGTITRQSVNATEAALAAQRSPLMVDGQPQFVIFCDGSGAYRANKMAVEDGGYAVVFRDPYGADKAASASDSDSITADFGGPREEDGINVSDFTIRHWYSHRTLGSGHVEAAAISQAFDEIITRVDQHRPAAAVVKIFSDSDNALERIERGILTFETTTAANSRKRKLPVTKKERANTSFFAEHTNPFVRAIVWQSHYLSDRGCTIELNWMPRNTTLGHALADHAAGRWRGQDPGNAFNQKYLPVDQRDGILDKLHEEVSAIVSDRIFGPLYTKSEEESEEEPERQPQRPRKRRRIRRATRAKKRSARDYIGLDPGDFIALDSESEEEPEPKLQPPKKEQKMQGAIRTQKRSTVDFILLDSESEEEPEPKPQTPKKRKKIRGAILPKEKAPMQQAGPEAGGFLNGGDHVFNFDPRNLPPYPDHYLHASHDPESGHGTPGCLLCQGDDYPWRSGYTGLPSQWALRRY